MVTIIRATPLTKQNRIFLVLSSLEDLKGVSVTREIKRSGDYTISITHDQMHVPDYEFHWCPHKEHYRVYMFVAFKKLGKVKCGHSVMNVVTKLATLDFKIMYEIMHKHRANKKI